MNHPRHPNLVGTLNLGFAAVLLSSPAALAQEAASTLHRLSHVATAVGQVRVLERVQRAGQTRVTLRTTRILKGDLPRTFVLTEAAGRACGMALHGALVGGSYIGFFHGGARPTLCVSSARSLVPVDPWTLQHVVALLRAGTGLAAEVDLLAEALESRSERVRADAAVALPRLRGLEQASTASRQRIVTALGAALAVGARHTPSLLRTADRLALPAAAEPMVEAYLAATTPALEPLLLRTIPRIGAHLAIARIERSMPTDARTRSRAVRLLAVCPGDQATRCLQRLAEATHPGLRSEANQALSARAARSAATRLSGTSSVPPVFRAIRPGGLQ